jgi:CheY-like chemotaxis protein
MPHRILYAEDHEDTRVLVAMLLRQAGFEVVEVVTGAAFMERVEGGESFDLYLLDHTFPDTSGVTLCRAVRERDSETPILFYSARVLREEREEALSAGASDYLLKPNDTFNVCAHAARWIGSARY